MVQKIFKVEQDNSLMNGWSIIDEETGISLELPSCIYDELKGKYLNADEMLERINTMQIALAGVTDSLRVVDVMSLDRRSVLKTFGIKSNGTIDDEIDWYLESTAAYEKYHTIFMDRDTKGNDSTIHAYIETPKNGRLRCQFKDDKAFRLNAKRNNIKFWIDNYKIGAGSNGGQYVMTLNVDPIEII